MPLYHGRLPQRPERPMAMRLGPPPSLTGWLPLRTLAIVCALPDATYGPLGLLATENVGVLLFRFLSLSLF